VLPRGGRLDPAGGEEVYGTVAGDSLWRNEPAELTGRMLARFNQISCPVFLIRGYTIPAGTLSMVDVIGRYMGASKMMHSCPIGCFRV